MDLQNVRVWLSGSIPNDDAEAEKRIEEFVYEFAVEVFRRGGTIVHGHHPTILPALARAADFFIQSRPGRKASLALFVSREFSRNSAEHGVKIEDWN